MVEIKAEKVLTDIRIQSDIEDWIENFLLDRRAQNLAKGTLRFYRVKLQHFVEFCESQAVTQVNQIDSHQVRMFVFWLQERGHNPGGVHAHYRALKAFVRFWAFEAQPENWWDPFKTAKAPKVPKKLLEGVDPEVINDILDTCGRDFYGRRDCTIILVLLDTGCRAAELLALDRKDVDLATGAVTIRSGKGRKPRRVFIGKKAKKMLKVYLNARNSKLEASGALIVTKSGNRLSYDGLASMVRRRAERAGVDPPTIHAFRRAFALAMLRAGTDIYTLQRLMGHSSLDVLRRYLAQNDDDLAKAHRRASPVDKLLE